MRREIKLYNLIFPMWGIYFWGLWFPALLLVLLPANFVVDSIMLLVLFFLLKLPDKKGLYKKTIWKTWGFGFLADILASAVLVGISWTNVLPFNEYVPIQSIGAFLFTTAGIVLAAGFIYIFQRKFVLKKLELEEEQKKRIALGMAILTAPYLMYLPPM